MLPFIEAADPPRWSALGDLADLLRRPEELPEAERMLRRTADIAERAHGEGAMAADLHRLWIATNLILQSRHTEAVELLEPIVEHFEAILGPTAAASLRARKRLTTALLGCDRNEAALASAHRHVEILAGSEWANDSAEMGDAYFCVYRAASRLERWDEALEASDRHLERMMDDPGRRAHSSLRDAYRGAPAKSGAVNRTRTPGRV